MAYARRRTRFFTVSQPTPVHRRGRRGPGRPGHRRVPHHPIYLDHSPNSVGSTTLSIYTLDPHTQSSIASGRVNVEWRWKPRSARVLVDSDTLQRVAARQPRQLRRYDQNAQERPCII
uniref:Uncharacterized protein n=1 Tax=Plectus sambesii TaxID=2011161 RepID=A0A914VS63_9BILA